jgi:hypothetical protein
MASTWVISRIPSPLKMETTSRPERVYSDRLGYRKDGFLVRLAGFQRRDKRTTHEAYGQSSQHRQITIHGFSHVWSILQPRCTSAWVSIGSSGACTLCRGREEVSPSPK